MLKNLIITLLLIELSIQQPFSYNKVFFLDAGSSHSELNIIDLKSMKFLVPKPLSSDVALLGPLLDTASSDHSQKVDNFVQQISSMVNQSLSQTNLTLLDIQALIIQSTAGSREVMALNKINDTQSEQITNEIKFAFQNSIKIQTIVEVIQGRFEGLFGLLDTIENHRTQLCQNITDDCLSNILYHECGGSSCQFAFKINQECIQNNEQNYVKKQIKRNLGEMKIKLNNQDFNFFSKSLLGIGHNDMNQRIKNNSCSNDYTQCISSIQNIFNQGLDATEYDNYNQTVGLNFKDQFQFVHFLSKKQVEQNGLCNNMTGPESYYKTMIVMDKAVYYTLFNYMNSTGKIQTYPDFIEQDIVDLNIAASEGCSIGNQGLCASLTQLVLTAGQIDFKGKFVIIKNGQWTFGSSLYNIQSQLSFDTIDKFIDYSIENTNQKEDQIFDQSKV